MRYIVLLSVLSCTSTQAEQPWPAPVRDFLEPKAGEHPRLFFRKADLPELRRRATKTPEGRAIVTQLRHLLGNNGEALPDRWNKHYPVNIVAKGNKELPIGAFTIAHPAGYGMLYQLTGQQPRLFRLPAGLYNNLVLTVIASHGLHTIQWDVVTADPVPDNEADNINRIVRENVQNGSIIIMHANGRGWHTAEALPEMIAYLREQGYSLVTVSQLIGLAPLPEHSQR